jgi:hypothetical protein
MGLTAYLLVVPPNDSELWVKCCTTSYLYTHRQYIVMTVQAYAAHEANGKLAPFEYELDSLKPDEVEIDVQ